jgi:hypothetical protein
MPVQRLPRAVGKQFAKALFFHRVPKTVKAIIETAAKLRLNAIPARPQSVFRQAIAQKQARRNWIP